MQALPWRVGLGALALLLAMPAVAQENIDAGKTPAQLYAKDCAICHKTPHGLARAGGMAGLQRFLREHYTASRESAAALAAYLVSVERAALPRRTIKHPPKNEKARDEKANKPGEAGLGAKPAAKPAAAKPAAAKPAAVKPAAAKPEEAKLPPSKPAEAKAEAKPEVKPEAKKSEAKSEAKSEGKPHAADAKTDGKTDAAKAGADAKPEKKPD